MVFLFYFGFAHQMRKHKEKSTNKTVTVPAYSLYKNMGTALPDYLSHLS